jgi:hypothetical protein
MHAKRSVVLPVIGFSIWQADLVTRWIFYISLFFFMEKVFKEREEQNCKDTIPPRIQ